MAYSHAFVLATTSFFLGERFVGEPHRQLNERPRVSGVLFIAFNVDYRLLYLPSTPDAAQACIQFYTTFHNAPFAVKVRAMKMGLSSGFADAWPPDAPAQSRRGRHSRFGDQARSLG